MFEYKKHQEGDNPSVLLPPPFRLWLNNSGGKKVGEVWMERKDTDGQLDWMDSQAPLPSGYLHGH